MEKLGERARKGGARSCLVALPPRAWVAQLCPVARPPFATFLARQHDPPPIAWTFALLFPSTLLPWVLGASLELCSSLNSFLKPSFSIKIQEFLLQVRQNTLQAQYELKEVNLTLPHLDSP